MEDKNFSTEINIGDDGKDNDILNQSYEDLYSINEKKNAIEKLYDDDKNVYQKFGNSATVRLVLNKNGDKICIAKYDENRAATRNCLNYAFLASCGERTPQILGKCKDSNALELEVQSFFQHDGENNYFSPNTGDSYSYVPYKNNKDYQRFKKSMIKDRTKEVTMGIKNNSAHYYHSYLYMYHMLIKCDTEFKTEFIDHFAILFADELCFDIQDRNNGNILVIPSKNGDGNDIVNIDVDFGWQIEICSRFYLELYLIAKEATFCFGDEFKEENVSCLNKILEQKYQSKNKGKKLNFRFEKGQKLKISPEIIYEIDEKIIEKIEQRLNFRKDKFLQYYIDNCIRRGDINTKDAFTDFQKFMESLYDYLKKQTDQLKTNKDFQHFSRPFDDFMKKYPNYKDFNNRSEEDFSKKWAERKKVLENAKKMEEKKVKEDNQKIEERDNKEIKIEKKEENENKKGKENETSGMYLIKLILIILGLLLIAGGIALFFVAPTLALKILAVGLGILGATSFGFGIFYKKIVERYSKECGSCCFGFWTCTIFTPNEQTKENNINLEKEEKNNTRIN